MALSRTENRTGFLSFNKKAPRVWITSSSQHPPEKILQHWQEDGFDVRYLPYNGDQETYIASLKNLHSDLELTEQYALVCYGDAAGVVLKFAQKPVHKCCAIIAYYPSQLPSPKHKYPSLLQVVVHIAGLSQQSPEPQECEWKCYRYDNCSLGFADPSARNHEPGEANLAASRSLAAIRRGFKKEVDIEPIVDEAWRAKYDIEDPEAASLGVVQTMTQNSPHVTILPTLQGGVGRRKLKEFYQEFFVPSLVDDFDIRLISRTIGVDRVVDEMVISFTHSDEIDWILPGVPPTDKFVEIAAVSIVAVRGGKLVSEHMYWDQASVLMQVGLLDPKVVPKRMKDEGLKKLPVVGRAAIEQLIEPEQQGYNSLLKIHGLFDGLNGVNGINGS